MNKNIYKVFFYNIAILIFIILLFELLFHSLGFEVKKKYLKPYYGNYEFGINTYPKNYFEYSPSKGFDIRPNQDHVYFYSPNGILKIFSNKYGCFDNAQSYENYVYLGGDSFVWGYDDYKKTLGVYMEKKLNQKVAKCGVTNTGQMHQYEKLRAFLKKNNTYPQKIIIGHYFNDLHDDFLFPESIVINGWLVKNPKNDSKQKKIKDNIIKLEKNHQNKLNSDPVYYLKNQHWIIYLINNSFTISGLRELREFFKKIIKSEIKSELVKETIRNNKIKPNIDKCSYENYNSPNCINKNKEAINKFISFSKINNIEFLIILIPNFNDLKNNIDIYKNLRFYLDQNNTDYIDFYNQIKLSDLDYNKLYNRDTHLSEFGIKFLIEKNIDKFK